MKEKAKYYQLFEQLKKDIFQGVYQNGQRLPGENEMAQEFSMSRQTVRQALALLEQEHLIQRRQGSGTYVHRPVPRPKHSWNVGIIATYISEYIFPSILRGIEGELSPPAGGIHRQKSGRPHCGGHQKRPAQPQFAPV